MHGQLLRHKMPNNPELNQVADFKPRKERREFKSRAATSMSTHQRLTDNIDKPRPDITENINDPEEEEKEHRYRQPGYSFDPTNMTLKDQQRLEYEEARIRDMKKLKDAKLKEQQEAQQRKNELEKKEEISVKIEESKHMLSPEPEEGDPNATTIQIRLPDGNAVTRRFLKSAYVNELYLYIRSLGEDAGLEEITDEFELMQQNKKYTEQDKTLEEVGLFPRAKIYCREL